MSYLRNKRVLITGAGSGIGRLMALKVAAHGAHLILWDINEKALASAHEQLLARGAKAHAYPCDVSDNKAVYETAARVKDEAGPVDVLINNAGIVSGRSLLKCSDEQIEKTFAVNTLAHFWTTKAFLPDMVRRDRGHIVTIASAGGVIGTKRLVDYCSSKFAAFGFDEALRMEIRNKRWNIETTVVCPYFINTGMFSGVKTRFAWLLPFLDENRVADKIVQAIVRRRKRLIMPITVYSVWLFRLLPVGLFDLLVDFLGVNDAMSRFRGRKSTRLS